MNAVDTIGRFLREQATDEARRRRQRLLTCVQRLMWARLLLLPPPPACQSAAGDLKSSLMVPLNMDLIRRVGESPLLSAAHCRWEPQPTSVAQNFSDERAEQERRVRGELIGHL